MAIRSTFFGITKLSGNDAKVFVEQVRKGRPSRAAAASLKRGRRMLEEFNRYGFVRITVPKGIKGPQLWLHVSCPTCGAKPGEQCRRPRRDTNEWEWAQTHIARERRADASSKNAFGA